MASVFLGINDRFFSYSFTVGHTSGSTGTGLRMPMDMALAPDDIMYIVNRSYEHPLGRALGVHIKIFKMGDNGDEYISEFGSYGDGPGQFLWPASITVDKDVKVYVSDKYLHRINIYSKDGDYLNHWGTAGSGDGELDEPSGLAIRDDIVFVVDTENHRVQKFTLDGKYVGQFGSFGDGPGQLNTPWGIGLDKDSNVFVADWRNDRIQSFTADGEWLASFGKPGTGGDTRIVRVHGGIRVLPLPVGEFNRPSGVCVDNDGDIYIADWMNNRVQVLTPEGRFITQFTGDAGLSKWGVDQMLPAPDLIRQRNVAIQSSDQEKLLWAPMAVKFDDARRRLIIADTARHRFQIYQKTTEPVIVNAETLTPQGAYTGLLA